MKTCECGGKWYRHGVSPSKRNGESVRYICKECKKTIRVRDGKVVEKPDNSIPDWRVQ